MALHPRVSVNLVSGWNWTLDQHLPFLAEAGFDTISLTTGQLRDDPAKAIEAVRQAGLKVVSVGSAADTLIESEDAALARLRPLVDTAAALDCPTAFTVTGSTPPRMSTDEACGLLIDNLGAANAYARDKGVRLAIEHSSPALRAHGFVNTLADAFAIAEAADIGVAVELQNCWYEGRLAESFAKHVDRIAIVQCNDFLVGEEMRMNRRVPGDGTMPLEWLIGRLLDAGYAGYFDLELVGPAIEAEGYGSAIRRGVDWLSECLARHNV